VPRKTLLITEVFPPRNGGSGRWLWEIYRRLPGAQVVVAAGEDPRQGNFDKTHSLNLVRMPLSFSTWGVGSVRGLWEYGQALWRLRRLVKEEGVQAIHCGKCLPEGLLALFLRRWYRLLYVCYVHGEELNLAGLSRELGWLTREVLHGARFVIANSRNTERILRQDWDLPLQRIRLLHPGADTEFFVPAARDERERARLGWDARPVILTVGRLQKRKGHDQMIRAVDQIRKKIPNVLYAILGDGEERLFLEDMVARAGLDGHVQFLGELTDERLLSCYQQCDLFVLPNRQVGQDIEGFGMVLVEAQACGKPVIAGASGGTAETMRIPETGLVVPCDGPDELADSVVDLLHDHERRVRMGRSARAWAAENFDWAALSRQAARLFQESRAKPRRRKEAARRTT